MDDYEQGLITGAGLTALIFLAAFVQSRLDARQNAKANAQWFRDHEDLRAPNDPDALRAADEPGALMLRSRDSGARGTK